MNKEDEIKTNRSGRVFLSAFFAYGHIDDFELTGRMRIGRTGSREKTQIQVPVPSVSGLHGEFGCAEGHWFYRDLNSTNGTMINNKPIASIYEMQDGDVLTVVPRDDEQGEPAFAGIFICLDKGEEIIWRKVSHISGMDHGNMGMLDVVRIGRSYFIATDGAVWEGMIRAAEQEKIAKRSRVDDFPIPVTGSERSLPKEAPKAVPAEQIYSSSLVIDIDERSVTKNFKKRVLLSDIHLTVDPGDMVLILGGSGAGKSTFIKSVMGYDKAEGTIRYGDKDVYADYEDMKREIGYVPQQDLVRLSDSVRDTLMAAARIRMPGDSSLKEQEERVDWLMDILGLTEERDNLIGAISGGQKKRVSIGIELAADPALFFLDEPDSGLDGPTANGLMEKLKAIADLGKIVMVITHSPDRAFDLFTKVIVLGKTEDNVGHLLFFGTPEEALAFFGTDRLENIVSRINRTSEGGEGLADRFYSRYQDWRVEHGS